MLCEASPSKFQVRYNFANSCREFYIREDAHEKVGLYLSGAAEGIHVVEDGDELSVIGGVQDVTVNFKILHHYVHNEGSQLQH